MPHGCMNVHVCVHKISLCAGVCVYMYLYVYIAHVCQCVCVCVRTCRYQSLRCHSSETVYFALETGSLINLNSLIFGSCWAPGIVLPLPPQFWDYKYHALLFHVGTGNQTQVLMLTWQVLYELSCLPALLLTLTVFPVNWHSILKMNSMFKPS